ncbi:hypothetical protein C9374_012212 [Naegleria lovaniensis]|uniref:DUF4116 domain-containing protein n=1 Tax=Naegleria lovaniensis TaxID=51637 RepID=A0AA88GBC6_NAELO|nr:uncharacterized protein C9374_012212 [Naegleria lovaniensis]KAG2373346.1 hypothetical protein C9374_012212 [Naegleria lovaniensis]
MRINDGNVKVVVLDFLTLNEHDDDDQNSIHIIRRLELLLNKKFSLQQLGKKKWLENRDLKYQNCIPVEFMNDRQFILNHIKKFGYGWKYASTKLQEDREFLLNVAQYNGSKELLLIFPTYSIGNDTELILTSVKHDEEVMNSVPTVLRKNKEFMLKVVQLNGKALSYAELPLKNDLDIVLAAVRQNGEALRCIYVDPTCCLRSNKDVILEAIKQNKKALQWVPMNLLTDLSFMLKVVTLIFPEFEGLKFASDDLKNDKDIALVAVKKDGNALNFVSAALKSDYDVVLAAVRQYEHALVYASNDLRNDKEIVLEAIRKYGSALCFASDELKKDREIVLEAAQEMVCA